MDYDVLYNNWLKIVDYIQTTYNFSKKQEIEWTHHVYYWIKLCVDTDGSVYIRRGHHGTAVGDYYFHPTKGTQYEYRPMMESILEEVELAWPQIKSILNAKMAEENILRNFEV